VFEWLQREYPGRFADGQLRTLQRHIKQWRAWHGPAKEVFFSQNHEPGHLCASDFTHASSLRVTIDGQPFPHLIYHFVLTYSNWEAGTVCFAESFESLSDGLQNALADLGGVPQVHRTDALTAAVPPASDRPTFQRRYQALLRHYGLQGQAINPTKSHENGDVEQSHRQFKRALGQALMLRGSRDFAGRRMRRSCGSCSCNATAAGRRGWSRSWPCCGRCRGSASTPASASACAWIRAALSTSAATPTRWPAG
jgi:hypothetical protein